MNNNSKEINLKAFKELLGLTFIIPSQQRGYKWTPKNVRDLLKDLWEFSKQKNKNMYCLQPIAVVKHEERKYEVLDGQQRLTTLFLLYKYLTQKNAYTFEFERDNNESDNNRWDFLTVIDKREKLDDSQIDRFYITKAYETIKDAFEKEPHKIFPGPEKDNPKKVFEELLKATREKKSVQVIWYETPKEKAYETFRNLNSGKISLSNSDLIKGLLLNRVNGLPSEHHNMVARQLEEMEQALNQNKFWFMLSREEPKYPYTRMDFLYNIVANVSEEEVRIDYRTSFRWFAENDNESLLEKWKQVRHTFLRLYDLYTDTYTYHYIGFLTYHYKGDTVKRIYKLIEDNEKYSKQRFVSQLRTSIQQIVNPNKEREIKDYSYSNNSANELRDLLLLYNIETLLQRYQTLKDSKQYQLQYEFEQFPFEVLYKQRWDIEHIASQTDNSLRKEKEWTSWLQSVEADYPSYFNYDGDINEDSLKAKIQRYKINFEKEKNKNNFNQLYEVIIRYNEEETLGNEAIKEDEKDNIWNLVLLDRHTNRSYKNDLFPQKRKAIITADGLGANVETRQFIPLCTMQCFTKAYNKENNVKLNAWTKADAEAYIEDIKEKLSKYLTNKKRPRL
ncbi:DUF262 domain-containing protein [Hoylesella saccharolytica]|uniref:DUF262 domain-containing protein n=1 Tax=Hoylesella saccharolytica TaxID=633701 RepID=UPI0028EEC5FD|nr:DUF262 domain-containing protein [Hoylesella saccharolytica]